MKTFIALIFASVLSLAAQTTPDPATTIDKYLSTRAEMGNFSGSVLVAKGDTVLIAKGYGFADMQNQIRFTPETRHSIASVSKMFTAVAALKAREAGKLRLDDSVCKFIESCPDVWKPVTILHLMRSTSGIPDYEEKLELASNKYLEYMKQPSSAARIVENARALPLDFVPGSKLNTATPDLLF